MADETPTLSEIREKLLKAAATRAESGISAMSKGDRSFSYDSLADQLKAEEMLRALEAQQSPRTRFTLGRPR